MKTIVESQVFHDITQHLEAKYPNEACGFLFGLEDNRERKITSSIAVENISAENLRRRFVIDPIDYLKAEKFALKEDLRLLGIYHSHPDHPAVPSIHDLEFAQPFFSYFIHSIQAGKLTETFSYRLSNGHFIPEPIRIKKNPSLISPLVSADLSG